MSARIPALLRPPAPGAAVTLTIRGEPASKANSREIVTIRRRDPGSGELRASPRVRKSDKALAFERAALLQIPAECRRRLTGPVRVTIHIFYASERPDLDESVLLDVLQDRYRTLKTKCRAGRELVCSGVYRNDRQVREKHVYHGIDRANPRAEIVIEPIHAQQSELQL
jgi:Holliday junction resolvase RusA-like endonuclease